MESYSEEININRKGIKTTYYINREKNITPGSKEIFGNYFQGIYQSKSKGKPKDSRITMLEIEKNLFQTNDFASLEKELEHFMNINDEVFLKIIDFNVKDGDKIQIIYNNIQNFCRYEEEEEETMEIIIDAAIISYSTLLRSGIKFHGFISLESFGHVDGSTLFAGMFSLPRIRKILNNQGVLKRYTNNDNMVCYFAPELFFFEEYDESLSDLWSLGILIYFLKKGKYPLNPADYRKIFESGSKTSQLIELQKTLSVKIAEFSEPDQNFLTVALCLDPGYRKIIIELLHKDEVEDWRSLSQLAEIKEKALEIKKKKLFVSNTKSATPIEQKMLVKIIYDLQEVCMYYCLY